MALSTLFSLADRVALVTGGCGGIGRTLAHGLAVAGADVAIADIDLADADEICETIESLGRKCLALQSDITQIEDVERLVATTSATLGGLDILVNNAGTNIRKRLDQVTADDWDRVLDLNLKSYFFLTRRAGQAMAQAGGGKVINMASLMATSVFRNPHGQTYAPYSASKGGVISLTRALAVEWAMENIQVNAICPTFIETPLTQRLKDDAAVFGAIRDRTPMGRFGRVDELVGPCVFLASAASDLITGTTLYVDGGWSAS
jgi:NAD(P)-dependent dehydrogenase (short-subunit alcohol dehydrogenase family)